MGRHWGGGAVAERMGMRGGKVKKLVRQGRKGSGAMMAKLGMSEVEAAFAPAQLQGRPPRCPSSASLCDFRGVSLKWLKAFAQRVLSGEEAEGTELVEFPRATTGLCKRTKAPVQVEANMTAKLLSEHFEDGTVVVYVPGKGKLQAPIGSIRIKDRRDWTSEDVSQYCVKTNDGVALEDLVYNQILEGEDPSLVGQPFQGAFVSHQRGKSFQLLVDSLTQHYFDQDDATSFVFLDIFCASDQSPQFLPRGMAGEVEALLHRLLQSELHQAVRKFQQVLLVVHNHFSTQCLRRSWILWELYGCTINKAATRGHFYIISPQAERERLLEKCCSTPKSFKARVEKMFTLDARAASASLPLAESMILECMEKSSGGCLAVNVKVAELLKRWLANELYTFSKSKENTKDIESKVKLAINGSLLFLSLGDTAKSHELLAIAWKHRQVLMGDQKHPLEAGELREMADILAGTGDTKLALKALEEAMKAPKNKRGGFQAADSDTSELSILVSTSLLLKNQPDKASRENALDLAKKAKELAKRHSNVKEKITTLELLGDVYVSLKRRDLALENYEAALRVDHNNLVDTECRLHRADIMEKAALLLYRLSDSRRALDVERQALHIRQGALGPDHPKTATSKQFVRRIRASLRS